MCKYCNALKTGKNIKWCQRSTYANDNICSFVCNDSCSHCVCNSDFYICSYNHHNKIWVGIEYQQIINRSGSNVVEILPFSETIPFNYCPICGEQISKEITSEDEFTYNNYLEILERDNEKSFLK